MRIVQIVSLSVDIGITRQMLMSRCFFLDSPKSLAVYELPRHEEEVSVSNFKKTCMDFKYLKQLFVQSNQTAWVSSPKDSVFPETIPEEASSVEEERVVIFRIPYASCKPSFYTVSRQLLNIFHSL